MPEARRGVRGGKRPPALRAVIAGVGGQGVLLATRVLAEVGMNAGLGVLASEIHGMSQRGGSVVSHLKLGFFLSPLVRKGEADVLCVLQQDEIYRTASFLRPGGRCFLNAGPSFRPAPPLQAFLRRARIGLHRLDADELAARAGSLVTANLVLLGYSLAHPDLPFDLPQLERAIREVSKAAFCELNLAAAAAGHQAGVAEFGEGGGMGGRVRAGVRGGRPDRIRAPRATRPRRAQPVGRTSRS